MNSGGWVVDENDEAIFIDIEHEENSSCGEYSKWSELPDLLLENIFSYLTTKERYYASCVCDGWHRAFYLPYVWRQFVLEDHTLTRSKFNYYLGWQYVLDHLRTSLCLQTIGKNIKVLIIKPMFNFSNLYEFMNILSWYIEQQNNSKPKDKKMIGVGKNIQYLRFTFPCDMTMVEEDADNDERQNHEKMMSLFGTGGKLLAGLKRLMGNLERLQGLELIDLMLEPCEAQFLLDEVCQTCFLLLKKLSLINTTKIPYQILHVGVFLNLYELHISPQNLGDELVEMLGSTNLKHLHIVQNRYTTEEGFIKPIAPYSWKKLRILNQSLAVHLEVESNKSKMVVWQVGAPVRTIIYNSPHITITPDTILNTIDYFKYDLRTYGHLNIPESRVAELFSERNDENLVLLIRSCMSLSTLVITEEISTCTVLLIAYTGRNLRWLHIRGSAVVQEYDWPRSPEWSDEFYSWLKFNSKTNQLVEKEVSQMLGYKWRFLSDKDFKRLEINLHDY